MKQIHTEIEIDALAEKVWRVLTEFADYRERNPFVRRVEREVRVGARVHVDIQPSGGKGMSFRRTILVADPNRPFVDSADDAPARSPEPEAAHLW